MRALRIGRSVWLAGGALRRALRHPNLRGEHTADVVVVGGGFTGAAVAATFARAGVRVALLEADRIRRGSTAASTALLLREPDADFATHAQRYGARRAGRIWQLGDQAVRELVATLRSLDVRCDLTELDAVRYTLDPTTAGDLRSDLERRRKAGLPGSWLTPGVLRRRTGISAVGAVRTRGASVDPYRACVGLVDAAARAGAAVFERSRVRRIEQLRSGVRTVTSGGSVTARKS